MGPAGILRRGKVEILRPVDGAEKDLLVTCGYVV